MGATKCWGCFQTLDTFYRTWGKSEAKTDIWSHESSLFSKCRHIINFRLDKLSGWSFQHHSGFFKSDLNRKLQSNSKWMHSIISFFEYGLHLNTKASWQQKKHVHLSNLQRDNMNQLCFLWEGSLRGFGCKWMKREFFGETEVSYASSYCSVVTVMTVLSSICMQDWNEWREIFVTQRSLYMGTITSTDKKSGEKQKLRTIISKYSFQQIAKTPARMTKKSKCLFNLKLTKEKITKA